MDPTLTGSYYVNLYGYLPLSLWAHSFHAARVKIVSAVFFFFFFFFSS